MSGEAITRKCLCPSSGMVYALGWRDITKRFAYYWNCIPHAKEFNSQDKPSWWEERQRRVSSRDER